MPMPKVFSLNGLEYGLIDLVRMEKWTPVRNL